MGRFLILIGLLSANAFANPPECPIYKNKHECLLSVEDNYEKSLDFIDKYEDDAQKDKLIQASVDIKKYETLACQKTCVE